MATKYRTIHYKRVVFSDPTISLQSVLTAALNGPAHHADDRSEQFTENAQTFRLINRHENTFGMLFGQFIAFEPGKKPIITLKEHSEYYPLAAADPGDKNAFTEEIFYFGVRNNDLVCAQTRSLRNKEFETHLAWLLATCAKLIDDDVTIEIIDQPSREIYERVENTSVKKIRIGAGITASPRNESPKKASKKFYLDGRVGDMLRGLFGADKFEKLKFEEDLDESNLEVSVEVRFVRTTDEEGQKAIDAMASMMRHIDDFDYQMKLNNGAEIKGDDLKISGKVSLTLGSDGLVDESALYKDMKDWLYQTLIDNAGANEA